MRKEHLKAVRDLQDRLTYDNDISFEELAEIISLLDKIKTILKDE